MKTLLVLGLLLVATNAAAQSDPQTNGIGFYWDEGGVSNCLVSAAPYTLMNAYLLATRISQAAGISGWEAEVAIIPPPSYPPIYTLNNGGENALTAPIFQVGLATALPYAPAIKLLTVGILNFGTPLSLAVGPCTPSSFGGLCPGYADGADPGLLIGLTPSTSIPVPGRPGFYVVAFFMYSVDPAERDSWSCVKSLYR
ncbi:MAG: hypothetical protein ACYDIE_00440 [Candidatus Krumholzibacteriia bacterium]